MSEEQHASSRSFYDRISHVYDLIADAGEHEAREKGIDALAARSGERILEIGFGTGHSLVDLAKLVGSTGHVSGVDIAPKMRDIAERRVTAESLTERVDLSVAAIPPLPYNDASFDGVFMSFVLELFPLDEILGVLREIARVLRPGGRVCVVSMATTRDDESDSLLEKTYKWLHQHFPHIVDCQPIDLSNKVRAAGYDDVEESRMEIWTLPIAIVVGWKPASTAS